MFGRILDAGYAQLATELGMVPAALDQWLDGGYDDPHAYPQAAHLDRVGRALDEA